MALCQKAVLTDDREKEKVPQWSRGIETEDRWERKDVDIYYINYIYIKRIILYCIALCYIILYKSGGYSLPVFLIRKMHRNHLFYMMKRIRNYMKMCMIKG